MNVFKTAMLIAAMTLSTALTVKAQDTDKENQKKTEIIVNQNEDRIEFIVKGRLAAVLQEDGLHVRSSIKYGEVISDYGQAEFDRTFEHSVDGADSNDAP